MVIPLFDRCMSYVRMLGFKSWPQFQLFASVYPGKQQVMDQVHGSLLLLGEFKIEFLTLGFSLAQSCFLVDIVGVIRYLENVYLSAF